MKYCANALLVALLLCCMSVHGRGGDASYRYADGNGNVYMVTGGASPFVEYRPVTPLESSSGIYGGGKPRKKEITVAQFRSIASCFDGALRDKASHAPLRVKGSGMVTVTKNGRNISCILAGGSGGQVRIETALKEIIKPEQ